MAVVAKDTRGLLPHQGKIPLFYYTNTTDDPMVALVAQSMVALCPLMDSM